MCTEPCWARARPSWRALQILTIVFFVLSLLVVYTATWGRAVSNFPSVLSMWGARYASQHDTSQPETEEAGGGQGKGHPIEELMHVAREQFAATLQQVPRGVEDAARSYREKRGRHPPPGFDAWYAYAAARNAVVPEVFFDQIYHDMTPFWGMEARELQRIVRGFSPKVTVRTSTVGPIGKDSYARVEEIMALLEELRTEGVKLPDVDIPVNVNDGAAMLVPWETMERAVEFARSFLLPIGTVMSDFAPAKDEELGVEKFDPEWLDGRMQHNSGGAFLGPRPFWSLVRPACPPDSLARKEPLLADIWDTRGHTKPEHSAVGLLPLDPPSTSEAGYVGNWTVAGDVCMRPELQGLYGRFVAPRDMSITQKLFPLFSASKLGASNEVLVPSLETINMTSPPFPWREKKAKLHWRGQASGGVNTEMNWRRMHRHRFVSLLNATHVEIAEGMLHAGNETTVGQGYARNFRLLPSNAYGLRTQKDARMAAWVSGWADATFTDLNCDVRTSKGTCPYTSPFFSVKNNSMENEGSQYKYAAVVDGDSGTDSDFVQRLLEGRAVLKASVYKQWYDLRLIPWVHFIPMDNTFVDLYGIMEYFLGTSVPSPIPEFPHAHVEVEKHEHHFQTPHWDEESDGDYESDDHEGHEEHGRRSADVGSKQEGEDGDGHDEQARQIADAGQEWAKKVLRKEDALVYMYRLVLEYARVLDVRRHNLGWVVDLTMEGR